MQSSETPDDIVEHTGGQVVAGSNPVSPTREVAGQGGFREIGTRPFAIPTGGT